MTRLTKVLGALALALALGAAATWLAFGPAGFGGDARDASSQASQEKRWFTCGMHPEVVQDHPGTCPKCGMQLQPMSEDRAAAMGLANASAAADPDPGPQAAASPGKAAGSIAAAGAAPAGEREVLYWKSTMIPGETRTSPGNDSMGMEMVPVYADEEPAAGTIRIDPVTEQNMGVRLDTVTEGPLDRTVRTVGYVDYDETTLGIVTTKVDGWVEKLYVDQTGVQVHRGDPLFELYSPELFSAQEEYLAARRNLQKREVPMVPGALADSQELVRAARMRLEYFDISPEQIAALERTGRLSKTLTIRSAFTGIVTHKSVVEGEMVKAGTPIFRIADLSTVWVIGKLFEQDLPYVELGQETFMTLTGLPGRTFHGRVTYVYPYLQEKTREASVRMEFHNPGYQLKPGMYATITLTDRIADEAILVPDTAVIDTGMRTVAFVRRAPGKFELREVRRGLRGDDNRLQVLYGLVPGETVVVSGQFLLDSESRLREAALKLLPPGDVDGAEPIESATKAAMREPGAAGAAAGHVGHEHEAAAAGDSGARQYYACPMPEHADVLYDAPGRCPLCGMDLVPVRKEAGHVERPPIDHWTCPMPEHRSVKEPGPGKCPICGMTLVPVPEEP